MSTKASSRALRRCRSRYDALLAVALIATTIAAAAGATDLKTGAFNPPRVAPDFTLRGSNGGDVTLSRYRGKVVALGFGYTSCPDVCPTTLALFAEARKKLGAARDDFQVLYVTVDPERDDAATLRKYVVSFDPTFVGLTGAPEKIGDVEKSYGVQVKKLQPSNGSSNYFVHHSSFVYLIDRAGNLRAMVPYGVPVDDVMHDVKALLGK